MINFSTPLGEARIDPKSCSKKWLSTVSLLLFMALLPLAISAQNISGNVTDETGEPLIGATILEQSTANGVVTDANGDFTLKVVEGSMLLVSYAGYQPQEIAAADGMKIVLVEGVGLEEVVVTAENRNVSAQRVPITMDIVSGLELQSQGVTDLKQLQALAPSLNIVQNESFTPIFIRGIGTQETGVLTDQSVTLNIDGEFITRPVALNTTLYDLARIEVLKGPQGTLYGKNSTAGSINIVAAKPRLEHFGGNVQVEYGNYNTLKFTGAVNAGLGKKSAIRAAFVYDAHDGYRESNGNPEMGGYTGPIDDGNAYGARLGFLTQPTDKLSIYVAGEIAKVDQFAASQYGISSDPEEPAYDPNFAPFEGLQPVDFEAELPDNFDVANPGSQEVDQFAVRANITYVFSDNVKLTYRGGYRDISMSTYQALNGYVPETFSFDRNRDFQSQSHELRLNGESDELIWQAGLFRGSDVSNASGGLIFAFARFLSAPAFDMVPYGFYNNWDTEVTTTGVFGQATYNFTDQFAFTGGLRYTGDAKVQTGYSSGAPFGPPGTPVYFYPNGPAEGDPGTAPIRGGDETWSQVTWLANFEFKPSNRTMYFAKVSTGYKSGGFAIAGPYDAESLTAFEVGIKNRLSDRFRLNASAFYFDYADQQIPVFIDVENGFAVTNAGESRIFGLEIEGDYQVSANGRFDFNINYLNAELTNFETEVNIVNGDGFLEISAVISQHKLQNGCSRQDTYMISLWELMVVLLR